MKLVSLLFLLFLFQHQQLVSSIRHFLHLLYKLLVSWYEHGLTLLYPLFESVNIGMLLLLIILLLLR